MPVLLKPGDRTGGAAKAAQGPAGPCRRAVPYRLPGIPGGACHIFLVIILCGPVIPFRQLKKSFYATKLCFLR